MAKNIPLPSQKLLHSLFDYCPDKGQLIWKVSRGNNRSILSKVAGHIITGGHRQIEIDGQPYLAHRLVWMWHNNDDPGELTVDHSNRQRDDNHIENLRKATRSQQARNADGRKGFYLDKRVGRYQVSLRIDGKNKSFGYFDCPLLARLAYEDVVKEYYGEFCPL